MYTLMKLVTNSFENENRDERELGVARELGFKVIVMAKGDKNKNYVKDIVNGFDVYRFSTRPLGNHRLVLRINRIVSLFTWAHFTRKLNADVISCHDILSLFIGYMSNILKINKALLIYDSHEFELGRNVKRGKLSMFLIKQLERYLIQRAFRTIMVNDIIADEVKKLHGLPNRPIVIRNIPNKWVLNPEEIQIKRSEYLRKFDKNSNLFIVMYHGNVVAGRGIEVMLEAIKKTNNTVGIILGNGKSGYINQLKDFAKQLNVDERVIFEQAVPYKEMWKNVACADVGLVNIENICKSYFYSLPNKYFENIQALTPIINSDFPAMDQITKKYNIGISTDCSKVENIANSIELLMNDESLYHKLKENMFIAKDELCWENEKKKLIQMYLDIIQCLS